MTHSVIVIVPSRVAQVAATIALVLPLLAQAADAQQARSSRRDARDRVDTTFAFDKRGTVTLRAGSGDIIVHGWTRDEIQIHASSENDNIRLDASPGRVSLELTSSRHDDSRFDVTVPVGARVIAHAQSGDISIRGTKGEVEVTSQSGAIELEDVTGRLDVNTTSGDLKGRGIAADVDITSISGDIGLTDVRGNIGIQSTSGEITLRSAVSRLVRAKTTSGDVTYEGAVDPAGRYDLTAHSGDVRLAIPPDASAQLTVSTWSGEIVSDFPITLQPGEQRIGSSNAKRFTFNIGGGAARITAATFSGDVNIRRTGSK